MNLGEIVLAGKPDTEDTFQKGRLIREKFLKEKYDKDESKEITPFNIHEQELTRPTSNNTFLGNLSESYIKNKSYCCQDVPDKVKKIPKFSSKAALREPRIGSTSFYRKIFSKASSNNLKIRQRLFKKSKDGFRSRKLELRDYYVHPGKENIKETTNEMNQKSANVSYTKNFDKKIRKVKNGEEQERENSSQKIYKFCKKGTGSKKSYKKRKNSSSQFLNCLKQVKGAGEFYSGQLKTPKHKKQKSPKKGLTTVPALKSLKTIIADHKSQISIRGNKAKMGTKFMNLRKALQKKVIKPRDKSDLKSRDHKFSKNRNSLVELLGEKHSFYNKRKNTKQLSIVQKRRQNLNLNLRKKLSTFKSNKTPISYKKSLSLGARKYGSTEPRSCNKTIKVKSKIEKEQLRSKLSQIGKNNSNYDFFNQKRHSLFTARSNKAHANSSMSLNKEAREMTNPNLFSEQRRSISRKSRGKKGTSGKMNKTVMSIKQELNETQTESENYRLKPVSSYFKNRSPFHRSGSFMGKKNPSSNYLNRNTSSKKMDYSLIIAGSETWRSRKNSEVNDYSAIKRTQNMINRKFRSIESKFNKSGIKIKSFIG